MNKDQADQLMAFLAQSEGNIIDVELLEHHFPWLRLDNDQLPRSIFDKIINDEIKDHIF